MWQKCILLLQANPFYGTRIREDVSPEDVLAHPVWKMGKKIPLISDDEQAFEVMRRTTSLISCR